MDYLFVSFPALLFGPSFSVFYRSCICSPSSVIVGRVSDSVSDILLPHSSPPRDTRWRISYIVL